jgi:hypothetical protein
LGSGKNQRHVLADETLDLGSNSDLGAGASGEEANDWHKSNGRNDASSACNALIVKRAVEPNLAAIHAYMEEACGQVAGFAPHSLVSDLGDFPNGWRSHRDHNIAAHRHGFHDGQLKMLSDTQFLPFCRKRLAQLELNFCSGSKDIIGNRRDGHGLRRR